jgi:hypothetical protein
MAFPNTGTGFQPLPQYVIQAGFFLDQIEHLTKALDQERANNRLLTAQNDRFSEIFRALSKQGERLRILNKTLQRKLIASDKKLAQKTNETSIQQLRSPFPTDSPPSKRRRTNFPSIENTTLTPSSHNSSSSTNPSIPPIELTPIFTAQVSPSFLAPYEDQLEFLNLSPTLPPPPEDNAPQ